jgi:hypothetical protein
MNPPMSTNSGLYSMSSLSAMKPLEIAQEMVNKWIKHLPTVIRFNSLPQIPDGPGFKEHTGILFGCRIVNGRFEFGIYFKDPLEIKTTGVSKKGSERSKCDGVGDIQQITTLPISKRTFKIFGGSAFSMTCYYNWDVQGSNCYNRRYTREFFKNTAVQMIPGDETSWGLMNSIFPLGVRSLSDYQSILKFLNGTRDNELPIPNMKLKKYLSNACHPTSFTPTIIGRRLKGKGKYHSKDKTNPFRTRKGYTPRPKTETSNTGPKTRRITPYKSEFETERKKRKINPKTNATGSPKSKDQSPNYLPKKESDEIKVPVQSTTLPINPDDSLFPLLSPLQPPPNPNDSLFPLLSPLQPPPNPDDSLFPLLSPLLPFSPNPDILLPLSPNHLNMDTYLDNAYNPSGDYFMYNDLPRSPLFDWNNDPQYQNQQSAFYSLSNNQDTSVITQSYLPQQPSLPYQPLPPQQSSSLSLPYQPLPPQQSSSLSLPYQPLPPQQPSLSYQPLPPQPPQQQPSLSLPYQPPQMLSSESNFGGIFDVPFDFEFPSLPKVSTYNNLFQNKVPSPPPMSFSSTPTPTPCASNPNPTHLTTPINIYCSGCDREIVNAWQGNPSLQCCRINICETCGKMKEKDWLDMLKQNNYNGCIGSWLEKRKCVRF